MDSYHFEKPDPDPIQGQKPDPDLHQIHYSETVEAQNGAMEDLGRSQ
jgi:hypothetical protein